MSRSMEFRPVRLEPSHEVLREEVRSFLRTTRSDTERPALGMGGRADTEFSRALGARGWLGMALPERYGGADRTAVDRFVVVEELLAAGAPVAAHWAADRQTAATLMLFGTERQRDRFLPGIAAGEIYFSIGMSEPDAGSDLAAVRTSATRAQDGWLLNGVKVWTSGAHRNHFLFVLCRTSKTEDRHSGLSQLIVDLSSPGITVRPIPFMDRSHDLNEVVFEDVFVPDDMVLGDVGAGWRQVTTELVLERCGPDRFLSTYPLVEAWLRETVDSDVIEEPLGRLFARYWALRHMSLAVAAAVDRGETPSVEAAIVKDLGTKFEQEVVRIVSEATDIEPSPGSASPFEDLLASALFHAPTYTLRGGTNEILRSVAAKGLR